jgi:DNA-binding MarR family transcriptional regulator
MWRYIPIMGALSTESTRSKTVSCSTYRPDDLMFLLFAATTRMTVELDRAAVEMGLNDVRDWLVLAALDDGEQRTQLELSRMVCVDKTTLIGVLDRLEQHDLIVRTVSPTDRRVRIPQITDAGRKVFAEFATARDAAQATVFEGIEPAERDLLMTLLGRIADREDARTP